MWTPLFRSKRLSKQARYGLRSFLLCWLIVSPPAWAQKAVLQLIRCESSPESLTLRLEFSAPVQAHDLSTDAAFRLRLSGLQTDAILQASASLQDPLFPALDWESTPDPVLVMPWRYRVPVTLQMEDSSHLLLRFQKTFSEESSRCVVPGLDYHTFRRGTPQGPLRIHVLRLNPSQPGLRIAPALAQRAAGFSLEPVSKIAERNKAIAGVNGAYFARNGLPLGLLMIDGEVITGPIYARTVLALGDHPLIERTALSAYLEIPPNQSVDLDGINQPRWDDQIVVYTDRWGERTPPETRSDSLEVAIDAMGRAGDRAKGNLVIPRGGFVVSAAGMQARWLAEAVQPGASVNLKTALSEYWEGAGTAIGGGPRLLERGRIQITSTPERFQKDVAQGVAPRTAVGITSDGKILLVTVDGRAPNRSIGMTLVDLAELMKELGAVEAMNFDGGGSTTFVLEGKTLNQPSDGVERSVSNALLIWSTQATRSMSAVIP